MVLGIGNTLLADEGAGVHAIAHLREHAPRPEDEVEYVDGGTLSFVLTETIARACHLVVIDAAELDAPPGTIRTFVDAGMDRFLGHAPKRSVHEVSLLDLLAAALLTDRLPTHRALIGIQPESVDWSPNPTPSVARAIPAACEQALALLAGWHP